MRADILDRLGEDIEVAKEVTIKRDRYGYTIDGVFMRRVTTMLRGIPKEFLGPWAAKMVAEYAVETWSDPHNWTHLAAQDAIKKLKKVPWDKRDAAAVRGTAIHETLDAMDAGTEPPETITDEELRCVEQVVGFHRERGSTLLASELTVYNATHGFAGTLDRWERHDGLGWILDYKTSGAIYDEHAVQQAAYQNCEFAIVDKTQVGKEEWTGKVITWGPDMAERLGIVHVTAEKAELHRIRPESVERLWHVFRAAMFVKKWLLDTDSFAGRTPRERIFEPTGE